MVHTVLLLALMAAGSVGVMGQSACPAPADVSERLEGLLHANTHSAESARITRLGPSVKIAVLSAEGLVLAERGLDVGQNSCEALAHAAAVVIASWMIDMHPEFAPSALKVPDVQSQARIVSAPPAKLVEHHAPRFTLGAGAGASVNRDGWAPSVALEAVRIATNRVLARMSLRGQGSRTIDVPPGEARYRFGTLAFGPQWSLVGPGLLESRIPQWRLGIVTEGQIALLQVSGRGFDKSVNDLAVEPRGAVGVRMSRPVKGVDVWFAIDLSAWIRSQVATVRPDGTRSELSKWDVGASVGAAFAP